MGSKTSLIQRPLNLRKLSNSISYQNDMINYDLDNLYPQRVSGIVEDSGTGKSCIENKAKYLFGDGFKSEQLMNTELNPFLNLKADDILKAITEDKAKYNAFALHFNYNVKGEIISITPLESKNCRFGVQKDDLTKKTNYIAYSPNWDYYTYDLLIKTQQIYYYHIFNPDARIVKEQIKEAGGIGKYKGQIYYATPKPFKYPIVSYHAVLNAMQFEGQKSIFNLSHITNNFSASFIMKYPNGFENEEEKEQLQDDLNDLTGAENAGSVLMVEVDPRFTESGGFDLLEAIPQQSIDTMYLNTGKDAKESIIESFSVPKILIGIYPDGGMINTANFKEAHEIYNSHVAPEQLEIQRQLTKVFDNFYINLGNDYSILPKTYNITTTTNANE